VAGFTNAFRRPQDKQARATLERAMKLLLKLS
jgi:hypothetical protein